VLDVNNNNNPAGLKEAGLEMRERSGRREGR
jgi:hypothetical protein